MNTPVGIVSMQSTELENILVSGVKEGWLYGCPPNYFMSLPTELDASFKYALPMLEDDGALKPVDMPHARRLLKAVATS